jgi:predicted transcriptional regulator
MEDWYHATMTKNITVRLPDDLAADAEAIARVEGTSLNETVKQALAATVAQRRQDPEFKARVARIIEEDRELLERLAR